MEKILDKVEKAHKAIEQLAIDEMEVNMKFNDVNKDELIQLAVQQKIDIDRYQTELGYIYSSTWKVCDQLIVVLETNYMPKHEA